MQNLIDFKKIKKPEYREITNKAMLYIQSSQQNLVLQKRERGPFLFKKRRLQETIYIKKRGNKGTICLKILS